MIMSSMTLQQFPSLQLQRKVSEDVVKKKTVPFFLNLMHNKTGKLIAIQCGVISLLFINIRIVLHKEGLQLRVLT